MQWRSRPMARRSRLLWEFVVREKNQEVTQSNSGSLRQRKSDFIRQSHEDAHRPEQMGVESPSESACKSAPCCRAQHLATSERRLVPGLLFPTFHDFLRAMERCTIRTAGVRYTPMESATEVAASHERGWIQRLELDDAKASRPVPRGIANRKARSLPDQGAEMMPIACRRDLEAALSEPRAFVFLWVNWSRPAHSFLFRCRLFLRFPIR